MTNARTAKSTREKAAALRAEAERKAARSRALIAGSSVLATVLVIVSIVVVFRILQKQQDDKAAAAVAPPANLYTPTAGLKMPGIPAGKPTAKVTLDIFEDFQCPVCKDFEATNKTQFASWDTAGTVQFIYHPIAFLDRASTTKYSTRALNAMAAVVNSNPTATKAFHDALFENQPPENGDGLPDATLIDLAVKAGATKNLIETAITAQKFAGWVKSVTDNATTKHNVTGTPTVFLNGKQLDTQKGELSPATLKTLVEKAAAG